ncbi:MAG TPA: hypothetical protein VKN18_20495 [Blastocatellia bacterium]|nr:hypothetical protein [Blastocatellia bacterium]
MRIVEGKRNIGPRHAAMNVMNYTAFFFRAMDRLYPFSPKTTSAMLPALRQGEMCIDAD